MINDLKGTSYPRKIFLYGPPGSGKTSTGRILAQTLDCPFFDLDQIIEKSCGQTVAEIFTREGEPAFRARERRAMNEVIGAGNEKSVIALGGGALLDPENRALVEAAGRVICLFASFPVLLSRVKKAAGMRPLLGPAQGLEDKLTGLLEKRAAHYASFPLQLDTTGLSPEQAGREAQVRLGWFHVTGRPDYEVIINAGAIDQAGLAFREAGLRGPVVLVSDQHVAPLYASRVATALQGSGYRVEQVALPPGEGNKTISSVETLWKAFVKAGLERGSTVAALGGGVVGDLTGFASATYLRGVPWAVIPTTLLAVCLFQKDPPGSPQPSQRQPGQ